MSAVASLVDALRAELVRSDVEVAEGSAWPGVSAEAEAVVHPATTEQVAATMRLASAHGVGVLVVASGERLHRSRRAEEPFVVLCTDRLSGIDIYEPADLTLTAGAGTPLRTLAAELHANRQWLPYDPPHADARSLGGLVATGESGPLCMGYGELRNHVLGLTLVTGDGRVLELGGRVVKNVAGFDLLKPVVGSRGRLGVITSACVRAFPEPARERLLALGADTPSALLAAARAIGTAPVMPVSCVLVAGLAGESGARLLVRLHGAETTVEADRKTLERHCAATFDVVEDGGATSRAARDHATSGDLVLTISVLPSRLGAALAAVDELLGPCALAVETYRGTIRVSARAEDAPRVARLRARVEALGGALGARAGRGAGAFFPDAGGDGVQVANPVDRDVDRSVDPRALGSGVPAGAAALTRSLEQVFDPKGVLWPCRP
ncbi:MAG: FAD-binding oxidoreductase [Gemmatimonadales bacterium]